MLDWQGCPNARDLGGLPTTTGGRTRPGALFRSEHLLGLTPAGLAADPLHLLVPMVDPRAERARDRESERSLLDTYCGILDRNGVTVAAALAAVAEAPPGGVLMHCRAGKDRTDIVVALLLRLVDVVPEVVVADYSASEANLAGYFAAELAVAPDEAARSHLVARQHTRAETMVGLLGHLDREHGGIAAYVERVGVGGAQVTALRERLLTG